MLLQLVAICRSAGISVKTAAAHGSFISCNDGKHAPIATAVGWVAGRIISANMDGRRTVKVRRIGFKQEPQLMCDPALNVSDLLLVTLPLLALQRR